MADLEALLWGLARSADVPGAVIARLHRGQEEVACFGVTSLENPLPVDESTLSRVVAQLRLGLAAAAVASMLACGSGPAVSTTPAATPTPTPLSSSVTSVAPLGASTPVAAVQALVATGGPTVCRPSQGETWSQAAGCPVTARLQQRLQSGPTSAPAGGADPICRCQNVAPAIVTVMSSDAATATVRVQFQFTKPLDVIFTVVQRGQGSGWLVDDSSCGDPSTSIYTSPVRPCG